MAKPRYAKKTLYLNIDALDRIEAALSKMPGGGASLSAFLNEQLPIMADGLERVVSAWQQAGMVGLTRASENLIDHAIEFGIDTKREIRRRSSEEDAPLFPPSTESVVQSQPTKRTRTKSNKSPEVINDEKPETIPPKQATSKRPSARKK